MCPKRRMHAETRKRYIRGLAAGDGRPGAIFLPLIRAIFTCANVIHSIERSSGRYPALPLTTPAASALP